MSRRRKRLMGMRRKFIVIQRLIRNVCDACVIGLLNQRSNYTDDTATSTMSPLPPLPRSPRQPPKSPPPSAPLMKLQSLGLELGLAGSKSRLQLPHSRSSRASTPSDLDKPLPLEPPDLSLRKRTSSVYSVETTITNIIDLYNGPREDDVPPIPGLHQASSYRDTLATLMNRRMSWEEDLPPMPPLVPRVPLHIETSSPTSPFNNINREISPVVSSATDSRTAPSFVEFSRNLQKKRDEMVSPFSTEFLETHRQAALDALAPTSPGGASSADMSPCDGTEFQHSNAFMPGPTSGTITDFVPVESVPAPLDLSKTSKILESQEAARQAHTKHFGLDDDDELDLSTPYPDYEDDRWSSDSATYKSIGEVSQHRVKETIQEPFLDPEDQRIMSYAAEKYPAMKSPSNAHRSWRSSGSSLTQRASGLVQKISLSGRKNSDRSRYSPVEETAPHERQRAIPPTPYQLYGPAIWKKESKKKKYKDRKPQLSLQHQDSRTLSGQDYPQAMQRAQTMPEPDELDELDHGQGQISSAFQRLTKSSSQRRREKLKNSIVLVGPTRLSKESNAVSTPKRWM